MKKLTIREKKKSILIIILFISLFTFSGLENEKSTALTQKQIQSGWYLEYESKDIAKLMHRLYGCVKYVNLSELQVDLTNPANSKMQVIDLRNIDTTQFGQLFRKMAILPVGGGLGYPIEIADFNQNNKLDFAGGYKWIQDWQLNNTAVVELNNDSTYTIKKIYDDSTTTPIPMCDADGDGIQEFNFRGGQTFNNYQSTTPDNLPDSSRFTHRMWQLSGQVGSETFMDFDNDGITDVLYMGDDSLPPWGHKLFIAEYDSTVGNFVQKFRYPPPDWQSNGFGIGDLDNDGFIEFGVGGIHGDVYIFENTGNDSYQLMQQDTISTSNAYLSVCTNDIDGNGKKEYFVGGSSYFNGLSGTRFYWYEATGNNTYTKVRNFIVLGTDVFGSDEIHAFDITNDGFDDILVSNSYLIYILTWNRNLHQFEVFYASKWEYEVHGVAIYDTYNQGMYDLYISVLEHESIPALRTYYYANNFVTSIDLPEVAIPARFSLKQNYPNPFNNSTSIEFDIPEQTVINLRVFNILGKEVKSLVKNKAFKPGKHSISWGATDNNGKEVSSGLYICVLSDGKQFVSRKILLIK